MDAFLKKEVWNYLDEWVEHIVVIDTNKACNDDEHNAKKNLRSVLRVIVMHQCCQRLESKQRIVKWDIGVYKMYGTPILYCRKYLRSRN